MALREPLFVKGFCSPSFCAGNVRRSTPMKHGSQVERCFVVVKVTRHETQPGKDMYAKLFHLMISNDNMLAILPQNALERPTMCLAMSHLHQWA